MDSWTSCYHDPETAPLPCHFEGRPTQTQGTADFRWIHPGKCQNPDLCLPFVLSLSQPHLSFHGEVVVWCPVLSRRSIWGALSITTQRPGIQFQIQAEHQWDTWPLADRSRSIASRNRKVSGGSTRCSPPKDLAKGLALETARKPPASTASRYPALKQGIAEGPSFNLQW